MQYFRDDRTGDIYAYEVGDCMIPAGLTPCTREQAVHLIHISAPPPTREQVDTARRIAYADPVTGSDRHFAEVVRLQLMGATPEEIEAARASGVSRYAAIQEEHPWPLD